MAVVIAALLPVFLLIVLGFILKRTLMRLDSQWHGLEQLTYYVLFPVLLVQTLVKADLTKVPVAGVGGALLLAALVMCLLCLALRGRSPAPGSTARPSPRSSRARPAGRPMSRCRCRAISMAAPASRSPRSRWSRSSRWSMSSASPCWRNTPHRRSDPSAPS